MLPDSFSALPWASGPVFMFFAPRPVLGGTEATSPIILFYAPGLVFDGTVGVGSSFHVWRSRTHFRRYSGPRVPFSCFALPDSFSVVPWASGPAFTFCALGLVFDGTRDVGSHFLVLRARNHFS
jgi:hypothetical protein